MTARSVASACSAQAMNSLLRCDTSITDIPEPSQSSSSSLARCRTGSGSMAGPAEKL